MDYKNLELLVHICNLQGTVCGDGLSIDTVTNLEFTEYFVKRGVELRLYEAFLAPIFLLFTQTSRFLDIV